LDNLTSIEHDEKFRLVRCKKCGLIYLNPRPTINEIDKYYPSRAYWSENENAEETHGYLYRLINNVKKGRVLDIGAGTGVFLSGFKKRGWKIDGVELSPIAVSMAKRKFKINLRKGDLLNIKLPENKFDLITLNHVLEHLYKPRQTLVKIARLLKKGGTIMISCPNIEGIGVGLFKNKWYAIDAPRHLYQFNTLTIRRMLTESGFKIVKVNHSFYWDNFYVLFESFRRAFSPRFNKKNGEVYEYNEPGVKIQQSLAKKVGILIAKVLSGIIAAVEPLLGRGEIVTILAVKIC
jgi:2-polyprenyl-3-methyl-5-hydroxy-6-metoxy-1,4-benzoquinol methylase